MMEIPPIPKLEELKYLTPSLYETLRICPLRGILGNNEDFKRYIYYHPKTIIGIVSHEIINAVNNNKIRLDNRVTDFDSISKLIKNVFRNRCNFYYDIQKESPFLLKFREVEEWPGYHLRLARLIRLIKRLFSEKNFENQQKRHLNFENLSAYEKTFMALEGRLRGRPDKIRVINENELLIEDYKTGEIYDGFLLKPSIRRQMLLYSFICQETFKIKNIRFVVIPLSVEEAYVESVDLEEAKHIAEELDLTLKTLNKEIKEIILKNKTIYSLATPSLTGCRFCSFKFFCEKFWENRELQLEKDSFSIQGKIVDYKQYGKFTNIYMDCNLSKMVIIKNFNLEKDLFLNGKIRVTDLHLQIDDDYYITVPTYRSSIFKL